MRRPTNQSQDGNMASPWSIPTSDEHILGTKLGGPTAGASQRLPRTRGLTPAPSMRSRGRRGSHRQDTHDQRSGPTSTTAWRTTTTRTTSRTKELTTMRTQKKRTSPRKRRSRTELSIAGWARATLSMSKPGTSLSMALQTVAQDVGSSWARFPRSAGTHRRARAGLWTER